MITFQVVSTTTDNAANFVKAFRVFGKNDSSVSKSDEWTSSDETGEEVQYVNLTDMLDEDETADVYNLCSHYRCAAHTLNLLATVDVQKVPGWSTTGSVPGNQSRPCFTVLHYFDTLFLSCLCY